jgi:hypothetical protein
MLQLLQNLWMIETLLTLQLGLLLLLFLQHNRTVKALQSIDASLKFLPAVQNQGRPPSSSPRRVA